MSSVPIATKTARLNSATAPALAAPAKATIELWLDEDDPVFEPDEYPDVPLPEEVEFEDVPLVLVLVRKIPPLMLGGEELFGTSFAAAWYAARVFLLLLRTDQHFFFSLG